MASLLSETEDVATTDCWHLSDAASSPLAELEIVHVVRQYAPGIGGLEEFVSELAAHQRKTFRRVRVMTCDHIFSAPETVLPAHETIDGIEVERLPYFGSHRYPVALGLWRAIASADIIHVHAVDFAFDALADEAAASQDADRDDAWRLLSHCQARDTEKDLVQHADPGLGEQI
ncbi:hypothetical protein [Breoghania sp.]|uniref:hypothetical protein n=1 Tax=Breoghania sp. TaxID=2065378 RepID=UPI00262485FE|nr:hypothetical protein [Breoghania sp.]MDJ0930995.1 hypothetical protein [Breoghania sp.]